MNILLEEYHYDNDEWGTNCYIDGKLYCQGMDEGQCLWTVLVKEFGANVEHKDYVWFPTTYDD
jgi:hypothetical protein